MELNVNLPTEYKNWDAMWMKIHIKLNHVTPFGRKIVVLMVLDVIFHTMYALVRIARLLSVRLNQDTDKL